MDNPRAVRSHFQFRKDRSLCEKKIKIKNLYFLLTNILKKIALSSIAHFSFLCEISLQLMPKYENYFNEAENTIA